MYSFLDYFEEVGMEKGLEQGLEQGIEKGHELLYYRIFSKNRIPEDISGFTGESVEYLYNLKEKYLATVREESHYDGNEKR